MKNLLNWFAISRHVTGGKWDSIRPKKIPKKYIHHLDRLFKVEIPEWWENEKTKL